MNGKIAGGMVAGLSVIALVLSGCSEPATSPSTVESSSTPSAPTSTTPVESPTSDPPAPSPAPEASVMPTGLSASGEVLYEDAEGYTYRMSLDWSASNPVVDVGSNPPGKTDIVLQPTQAYVGTFTNTTTGGRTLPVARIPSLALVAIYDASSATCAALGWVEAAGTCAVYLQEVLSAPRAGGVFDGLSEIPNGQPIDFGFMDLAASAAKPEGRTWGAVDEVTAPEAAKGLGEPLGFGLAGPTRSSDSFTMPITKSCLYKNEHNMEQDIALLEGGSGAPIPGCSQ